MADGANGSMDPSEIRQNMRQTRREMDETVDALGERLSPGRLLDEAWSTLRKRDGSGVSDILRDHPLPVALMGLGLGWLALERSRSESPGADGRHPRFITKARATGGVEPRRADVIEADGGEEDGMDAGTRIRSGVATAGAALKEAGSDAADLVVAAGDRTGEGVTDAVDSMRDVTRRTGRRTSEVLGSMMEENPLAVGAVAFGFGLASGLSVPSTELEDRLVGRAATTVKEEASRVASEHSGKVKRVVQEAAHAALDEADLQAEDVDGALPSVEKVREASRAVGQAAREAAKERAQNERLDADSLKKDLREAGGRIKDHATSDEAGTKPD